MNRRQVLAACSSIPPVLAGCLDLGDSNGYEVRELPQFPDHVTAERARSFVDEHESALFHNARVDGTDSIDSLSIGCDVWTVLDADGGYVIDTHCAGSVESNGEVAELAQDWVIYHVNDEGFRRVSDTRATSVDPFGNPRAGHTPRDFQVVNFDSHGYDFEMEVEHRDAGTYELIHQFSESVDAEETLSIDSVTQADGEYRTTIALENGESAAFHWGFEDSRCSRTLVCCIVPAGTVHIAMQPGLNQYCLTPNQ